jgi:hypothetical protein
MSPDPADIAELRAAIANPAALVPRGDESETIAHWSALAVLAALGSRLLPRGGEGRTEWGNRFQLRGHLGGFGPSINGLLSEATARARHADLVGRLAHRAGDPLDVVLAELVRRTITRFPDGSELVGPWLNVEEGTKP